MPIKTYNCRGGPGFQSKSYTCSDASMAAKAYLSEYNYDYPDDIMTIMMVEVECEGIVKTFLVEACTTINYNTKFVSERTV